MAEDSFNRLARTLPPDGLLSVPVTLAGAQAAPETPALLFRRVALGATKSQLCLFPSLVVLALVSL